MADRELRVECECKNPTHFIQINLTTWDKFPDDIEVFFCADRVGGFWKRIIRAAQYVFWSQQLITADMRLSKERAREAGEFLISISEDQTT